MPTLKDIAILQQVSERLEPYLPEGVEIAIQSNRLIAFRPDRIDDEIERVANGAGVPLDMISDDLYDTMIAELLEDPRNRIRPEDLIPMLPPEGQNVIIFNVDLF